MISQEKYIQSEVKVFLFINSGSGGGLGKQLIETNLKDQVFQVPRSSLPHDQNKTINVRISFFNMRDNGDKSKGLSLIKEAINQNQRIILVICGGDGTVMWVVSQLHDHNIDHMKVPIAIIPLGTGNDFSRALGWGKSTSDLLDNNFFKLKKKMTYLLSATQQDLDIWMIKAEVQPYGKFQKVQNQENKVLQGKTFQKHFCNYFSVGIDGKIGYSFDKHRTTSRIGNLAMYGALGLVKSLTKTKSLDELGLQLRDTKQQGTLLQKQGVQNLKQSKYFNYQIFQPGDQIAQQLASNQNLMALNINSLMGGCTDVWRNAKEQQKFKKFKFQDQSHSDGKIQFVSFGGAMSLGLQNSVGGNAIKVYQGSGPFEINFSKKYPQTQKHRTYLQIDGQFIRFTHPLRITIEKSNLSKTSKIRVLRKLPDQIQKGCCAK